MTGGGRHPRLLLSEYGLSPRKALGQSFLCQPRVAARIVEGLAPWEEATILEIGAGLGALTRPLLERARAVIAIERDRGLADALRAELGERETLCLIEADATQCDWVELLASRARPHVVVGNLPYSITGPLISQAIAVSQSIDGALFMVQREVGERLRAAPGSRSYGALTVFTQAAFEVERVLRVGPGAFFPPPKVESVVLRFVPRAATRVRETASFRRVVKSAFANRRKMLRNGWRSLGGWSAAELERRATEAGICLEARPETIDVAAFGRMAEQLERHGDRGGGPQ